MKGFLSEGARDTIAILGIVLAIIQIVVAFLLKGSEKYSKQSQQDQNQFRSRGTVFGATKEYFRVWREDDRDFLYIFLASIAAVFVLSILFYYLSDDGKGLIVSLLPFVYFAEFGFLAAFLSEMDRWLTENPDTAPQVFKWRAIVSASWLLVLFLCIHSVGRFEPDAHWFTTVIAFEMMGFLLTSALMLIFLTYKMIRRLFFRSSVQ